MSAPSIPRDHFRQTLAVTPFHPRIAALAVNEDWTTWNDYKVPRLINSLSTEYFSARSGCSVTDITPIEKYRIYGKDAFAFLDRLVTRDLSTLGPGRVSYVFWCNDAGRIIDDGTIFQLGDEDYMLCSQPQQLDWLLMSSAGFDVKIALETHDIAALSVQGPTSFSVLTAAGIADVASLSPFDVADLRCGDRPVAVSRTGYTGDLGYELWMSPEDALPIWDAIFAVQDHYSVQAVGLATRETLRVEAGFAVPGADFPRAGQAGRSDGERSPYEVGLGDLVDLDKGHFTGRRALRAEAVKTPAHRLTKIIIEGNRLDGHAFIFDGKNGRQVGDVKSTAWSPSLMATIALADITLQEGKTPEELWVRADFRDGQAWNSAWARCHVQEKPFYESEDRLLTPPKRR